jgi:hypothetical protein
VQQDEEAAAEDEREGQHGEQQDHPDGHELLGDEVARLAGIQGGQRLIEPPGSWRMTPTIVMVIRIIGKKAKNAFQAMMVAQLPPWASM